MAKRTGKIVGYLVYANGEWEGDAKTIAGARRMAKKVSKIGMRGDIKAYVVQGDKSWNEFVETIAGDPKKTPITARHLRIMQKRLENSHLERAIAEVVSKKESLPRWSDRKGWIGGNSKTLYTFTDNVTDRIAVAPGGHAHVQVGPNAEVRMATRAEAEALWQSPLSRGWKVAL